MTPRMLSRAPGSASPEDIATDAVVALIQESGLAGLTMRGIARRLRMHAGIVNQWFGSREAMLEAVTYRLGARRIDWLRGRLRFDGLVGLLPPEPGTLIPTPWGPGLDEHDDAMAALRTWLALAELARSIAEVSKAMSEIRGLERDLLVGHAQVAAERLDGLVALLDGLQVSLFPPREMSLAAARVLLIDFARTEGLVD